MREKVTGMVGMTVRVEESKRDEFNEYAKKIGISPGCLLRNFIHTTIQKERSNDNAL